MKVTKTFRIHDWQERAIDRLCSFDPGESQGRIIQCGIEWVLEQLEQRDITALELWVELLNNNPSSWAKREREKLSQARKEAGFPFNVD